MSSTAIALIAFVCMFAGTLLGALLRKALPGHHLGPDSRDVVKLGAGLMATQAALVLGLLVSSAKDTYDTVNTGLTQGGARIILLDRTLSRYGPESREVREQLRHTVISVTALVWPESRAGVEGLSSFESSTRFEAVTDKLQELTPQNDSQRLLKTQALQIAAQLTELRWLMIEQAHGSLPTTFLVVLVFWFIMLFATFALLTPGNTTVMAVMLVCALSVAGGLLLILEMNSPLQGLMKVSAEPLQKAIEHLGR